ncbi:MAG: spermidine synthase [Caulobacter sp.]|nr:spermidine synthase [Caulobacter sp.]
MTTADVASTPARSRTPAIYVAAVFASAGLVFLVEPMVAKLLLPLLGGSSAVWNTSLAFFQAALLGGYLYAHLLQKLPSLRRQTLIHITVLLAAALVLPLRVSGVLGDPATGHPALWLLGVLTLSIGAPFAALSATAPLLQAWRARTAEEGAGEPYALYAASNLGSLLALLAYPLLVEPLATLQAQRFGWSLGYGLFVILMAAMAAHVWRAQARRPLTDALKDLGPAEPAVPVTWKDRLAWLLLAAIPSSLMLGVTAHLATDVASAPFLWVVPLALYLITFIIAFQDRPVFTRTQVLVFQGAAVAAVAFNLPYHASGILMQIGLHLAAFFLTALMCHQALVARRPAASHLTEFYLWMSLGGVVGGAFNAFLAPVIFSTVLEYPMVLVASVFVRPWGEGPVKRWQWITLAAGIVAAHLAVLTFHVLWGHVDAQIVQLVEKLFLGLATLAVFLLRGRALLCAAMVIILALSANMVGDKAQVLHHWRSFFGVLRETKVTVPGLGGEVRMLAHGTTLHGAQAQDSRYRCRPLVYYAPETPIGQVFIQARKQKPAIDIGAVGLGTGSVAAYTRKADRLTFFEIDPLVVKISTNPANFSYTTECARGQVSYVLGDARLTLARQPPQAFDVLLIDAFSSDSVPAHLLTVEAIRGYLGHLKPGGVLILHLSNRNLELRGPAMAAAVAAGGVALLQRHIGAPMCDARTRWPDCAPNMFESSEDAVIVGRDKASLAAYAADSRWTPADPTRARPWTDNYTNLFGAMWARVAERLDTWFENTMDRLNAPKT